MEEGLFPLSRASMDESELEEERRLAYVGITRAKQKLYLSNAYGRMLYGQRQTILLAVSLKKLILTCWKSLAIPSQKVTFHLLIVLIAHSAPRIAAMLIKKQQHPLLCKPRQQQVQAKPVGKLATR